MAASMRTSGLLALLFLVSGCSGHGGVYQPSPRLARIAAMEDPDLLGGTVEAAVILDAVRIAALPRGTLPFYAAGTIADSPLVREVYYGLRGSAAQAEAAAAVRGPQLSLGGRMGGTDSAGNEPLRQDHALGVDASLLLFDGGQAMLREDRARWKTLAALASIHQRVEQVAYGVADAYIGVLKSRSALRLANGHVGRTSAMLAEVRTLAATGAVGAGDIPEAEARLDQMREYVVQARRDSADAEAKFRRVTGVLPPAFLPVPAEAEPGGTVDGLSEAAANGHPAIKVLDAEVQAGIRAVMAVDAERFGSLGINLGTSGFMQAFGGGGVIGLGLAVVKLSLPVIDSGDRDARLRAAAADLEVSIARRQDASRSIELQVHQAWNAREAAIGLAELATRQQADYGRVFRAKHADYRAGLVDLKSALDAEQMMMEAESKADAAGWDRKLAGYALLATSGRLADRLGAVTRRKVAIASGEPPFPMPSLLDP